MRPELVVVAVIVGLGTWLFRAVPARFGNRLVTPNSRLAAAMEGIGPAAIATLFVASIMPELSGGGTRILLLLIGSTATILTFRLRRNVVLATIAGAIAYGVAAGLMMT